MTKVNCSGCGIQSGGGYSIRSNVTGKKEHHNRIEQRTTVVSGLVLCSYCSREFKRMGYLILPAPSVPDYNIVFLDGRGFKIPWLKWFELSGKARSCAEVRAALEKEKVTNLLPRRPLDKGNISE